MSAISYAEFQKNNSEASPAWRYERAQKIIQDRGGRPHRTDDDRPTVSLVKYLSARDQLMNSKAAARMDPLDIERVLYQRRPVMHQAYKLFSSTKSDMLRYMVEARLLTRQPYEDIAGRIGVSEEAVRAYEALYFNVRGRLSEVDYIVTKVFGRVFQMGLGAHNPELLCKYFAYFGGEKILDLVAHGFTAQRVIDNDEQVLDFMDSQIQRLWRVQALVTSTTLQPGRFDIRTVFEAYTSLMSLDLRAGDLSDEADWVTTLLEMGRNSYPLPRGEEAKRIKDEELGRFSVGHIELRAAEQNRFASERNLPFFEPMENYRLPPPDDTNVSADGED